MKCLLAIFALIISSPSLAYNNLISYLDNNINFEGRYFDVKQGRAFDWGRTKISFNTNAKEIIFLLKGGKANYNLAIDNVLVNTITTKADQVKYSYKLDGKEHYIALTRRNDSHYGEAIFQGVELVGGQLLSPPKPFTRKLEWIGDSWFSGYGVEGESRKCKNLRSVENAEKALPSIVSNRLNAQMHLISISGKGVVRNYGHPYKSAPNALPNYYHQATAKRRDSYWQHSKFQADAAIINLGRNDYTTTPHPDDDVWIAIYQKLIGTIERAHNKAIPIFIIYDPTMEKLAKQLDVLATKENITFITIDSMKKDEYGCHAHPKVSAHLRWADNAEKVIREGLDWN